MKLLVRLSMCVILFLPSSLSFSFGQITACPTADFIRMLGVPSTIDVPGIGQMTTNRRAGIIVGDFSEVLIERYVNDVTCFYGPVVYIHKNKEKKQFRAIGFWLESAFAANCRATQDPTKCSFCYDYGSNCLGNP